MIGRGVVLALVLAALMGCGQNDGPMSTDLKPKDPYAGMTKEQKIEAIRNDPKINGFQKETMIKDVENGK